MWGGSKGLLKSGAFLLYVVGMYSIGPRPPPFWSPVCIHNNTRIGSNWTGLPLPCIILWTQTEGKNGGGLGTRLGVVSLMKLKDTNTWMSWARVSQQYFGAHIWKKLKRKKILQNGVGRTKRCRHRQRGRKTRANPASGNFTTTTVRKQQRKSPPIPSFSREGTLASRISPF